MQPKSFLLLAGGLFACVAVMLVCGPTQVQAIKKPVQVAVHILCKFADDPQQCKKLRWFPIINPGDGSDWSISRKPKKKRPSGRLTTPLSISTIRTTTKAPPKPSSKPMKENDGDAEDDDDKDVVTNPPGSMDMEG